MSEHAIIEIAQDLFFIERGYLNGNHFVYRGPQPVLIDTAYKADFKQTQQLISSLGVNLADVRLIVNTHSHCDHIGGNKIIQAMSGCDIALHHVGKHFSDTQDDWSTWWRYFGQEADFFVCTLALHEGDLISLGPYEFQVIYTPGHAADGIALYNASQKILISSDALWGYDTPIFVLRVEGSLALQQALESLDKLAALDVKQVYPGHGPPFTDLTSAITKARQRIDHYKTNREKLGLDILKRMIVYLLLMDNDVKEAPFLARLMHLPWFKENIEFHFHPQPNYEDIYHQIMSSLFQRGVITRQDGKLFTSVKP